MVNEEKVRLMTKLAIDETKLYKEEIEQSGYFRSDYIRAHTMKVLWAYSLSYLLLLGLVALYHLEYLFVNVVRLDIREMALLIGGGYIGILIVVIMFCILYYSAKYTRSRQNLRVYMAQLKELEEFYAKSKEGGTV
ncbi:MAG: hypothetical protein J1E62_00285 [Lachnospiraceae bacterium]|nr:hypothetical protein [Lachnospiraceae bacterium]